MTRTNSPPIVHSGRIAAGLGVLWLALAIVVITNRHGAPIGVDRAVLGFMVGHRDPALTTVLTVVTTLGGTIAMTVLTVLAGAWLAWRRDWRQLTFVLAAGVGAAILVPLTKNLIGRHRPSAGDQLVAVVHPAFPSGHALGSIAVVGAVSLVAIARLTRRPARITVASVAVLFVLAVGVSRLYLGVHWATDVAGGWLLGGTWLAVCPAVSTLVARTIARRRQTRI